MDEDGRWDIWMIEASGGLARRLTHRPGDNGMPSWSRDGKHVYFHSGSSGQDQIWRVSSEDGSLEQITHNGGFIAFESDDGNTLYYTKSDLGAEGLFAISLPGGKERQVIKSRVVSRAFAVFEDGIYYVSSRDLHPFRFRVLPTGPVATASSTVV
jgi:Tol biopolymer transport system component